MRGKEGPFHVLFFLFLFFVFPSQLSSGASSAAAALRFIPVAVLTGEARATRRSLIIVGRAACQVQCASRQ